MSDESFWRVVRWTIYGIIVSVLVIGYLIPMVLALVFNVKSEYIATWFSYSGVLIGLLSAALGCYSVYSASKENRIIKESINQLQSLTATVLSNLDKIETELGRKPSIQQAKEVGVDDWKDDDAKG